MAKTRIVIFGWAASVHVQRWSKGLTDRGYQVKVISPGGNPIDGVDTTIIEHHGAMSYLTKAGAAAREARKFKPDLIHVHYAGGFSLWGLRARLSPMVVSVWGTDVTELPQNPAYRWLIKRILKRATAVTATSSVLKDTALQLQPAISGKVSVIPFGVPIPVDPTPQPQASPISICYLKMHEPRYGPDILLKAMSKVKERFNDIQLNMVGEGSMTPTLRRMITDLGLSDNVHLLGWINNTGIYQFISKHHFMVMPSLSEAFGVAVLECGACRKPSIATRVGGIPEVLVDGKTGILVDGGDVNALADAIIKMAENADLRNRMGNAAFEYVKENYTWEKSLDLMTELYERLIHEKGKIK